MRGEDELSAAAQQVGALIAGHGDNRDAVLERLGADPAGARYASEQRALRAYGVMSGQLSGPVARSQSIHADKRLLRVLQSAWLNGMLVGLALDDGPALTAETLARAARQLDGELDHDGALRGLRLDPEPVKDIAVSIGMKDPYGLSHRGVVPLVGRPCRVASRGVRARPARVAGSVWVRVFPRLSLTRR